MEKRLTTLPSLELPYREAVQRQCTVYRGGNGHERL